MSRFEYTSPCPECLKVNASGTLGFETDSGKVVCNGPEPHEFEEMPGESAPVPEPETVALTSDFAPEARGPEREFTPEEEAALDKAMQEDPRPRDFGAMVTDPLPEVTAPEIVAPEQPEPQGEAVLDTPATVANYSQCCVCHPGDVEGHYCDAHVPAPCDGEAMGSSPRVGLGEVVTLPNGDAICGVRVSELWVSAMVAEGENRTPALNLAEYLQEIMDTGLIEWHASIPGAR